MARHWIFDLDGTLIDSYPLYRSVFEEVAEHFKVDLTPAWSELYHLVLPKFLEKYFSAKDIDSVFNMVIERNMARQDEIEVYGGIYEVLDHLKNAGCVMSICTARELKSARGILESKNLERYFGQVISRDCVTKTKPHPEGIQRLMTSFKTSVHETLMIGDHKMDIEAAKGAGIRAISVSWSPYVHEDLSPHSDHHFKCVDEFHRWVVTKVPGLRALT